MPVGLSQQALLHRLFCSSVILGDRFFVSCHGVKKGAAAPCVLPGLSLALKVVDKLEANLSWANHVLVVAPHGEKP